MDEKLELFREQSKHCAFCGKDSMINGVGVHVVKVAENGKISGDMDSSLLYPACAYHLILIQNGMIAATMDGQTVYARPLPELEPKSDEELKQLFMKLKRKELTLPSTKIMKIVVKVILEARDFQRNFDKRLKGGKQSVQDSGNKAPDGEKLPS